MFCFREYTHIQAREPAADFTYGDDVESTSIHVEKYQIGRSGSGLVGQDTISEFVSYIIGVSMCCGEGGGFLAAFSCR